RERVTPDQAPDGRQRRAHPLQERALFFVRYETWVGQGRGVSEGSSGRVPGTFSVPGCRDVNASITEKLARCGPGVHPPVAAFPEGRPSVFRPEVGGEPPWARAAPTGRVGASTSDSWKRTENEDLTPRRRRSGSDRNLRAPGDERRGDHG